MKQIIILGAGGLGQEIAWLIEEINESKETWQILGYLDSHPSVQGLTLANYPVLGTFEDAIKYPESYFVIAFGDPRKRYETFQLVSKYNLNWATLISPTVRVHESNKLGTGVVIGRNTNLTLHCELDDFVMLNIHVVIGHDVKIGKFSIVSPNVTINGGARIGKICSIGANAFVRDINIDDLVTVGACSCVVKDVASNCVVGGVPAKIIQGGVPNNSVTKTMRGNN
jgi:sugar O-acyltransferase (sialic acid O-acetyltransferase NeuD family)